MLPRCLFFLNLTRVKQGFNVDAVGHVQFGLSLKNLREERRSEADFACLLTCTWLEEGHPPGREGA